MLIDFYLFQGIRHLTRSIGTQYAKGIQIAFWIVTIVSLAIIISGTLADWRSWPKALRTYMFAFVFVTYFSKLFMLFFMLLDDLYRLVQWIFYKFIDSSPSSVTEGTLEPSKNSIPRSDFIIRLGAIVAAIPFTSLLFGMIKGKYEYQVRKLNLTSAKISKPFNGFKVVQISDLHVGSFNSAEPLKRAVQMINDLKPDIIFFTGDLVNDKHDELLPYKNVLADLKATEGVFSVLGNHDYGDYYRWGSDNEKVENLQKLKMIQKQMGWNLLLDEHITLNRNGSLLNIAGVQNWSGRRNFAKYGNLNKALKNIPKDGFNILMSHDPSHWKEQILQHEVNIDLTLSGHTHGFQFGIEIPGFKWSPVQYVYNEWAGSYVDKDQSLYVNRGLGFLGYPGRVGILPEITYIELNSGENHNFYSS